MLGPTYTTSMHSRTNYQYLGIFYHISDPRGRIFSTMAILISRYHHFPIEVEPSRTCAYQFLRFGERSKMLADKFKQGASPKTAASAGCTGHFPGNSNEA